ncbi:ROK family transcriptional regulator [Tamaricihabitans halophyticus]|nr:ROK family transcriptional regulator [Tamaricihabitans halophyticus]
MANQGVGAGAQAMRRHNVALLMEMIARSAPISRVELARRAGLTKATVSSLVAELIQAELVRDLGPEPGGAPGRPAGRLMLDPYGPVAIGLQFAPDHIAGILLDLSGRQIARDLRRFGLDTVSPTDGVHAARPVLRRLFDEATTAGRLVAGVGLAVSGTVSARSDSAGTVAYSPALGWSEVDARALVNAELHALGLHGLDVRLDSEVACAAHAEYRAGAGGDWYYLGGEESLGLVPVSPGSVLAGEFGHVPVRPRGPRCFCGERGCLRLYAEPAAIARSAGLPERSGSRLLGGDEPLIGQLRAAEPAAVRAVHQAADAVASGLVPVRALLAPEVIVLGGRLASLGEVFWNRLHARLPDGITLRQAKLGPDAALRGAAAKVIGAVIADPLAWIDG